MTDCVAEGRRRPEGDRTTEGASRHRSAVDDPRVAGRDPRAGGEAAAYGLVSGALVGALAGLLGVLGVGVGPAALAVVAVAGARATTLPVAIALGASPGLGVALSALGVGVASGVVGYAVGAPLGRVAGWSR
jgi:hypothetical protein